MERFEKINIIMNFVIAFIWFFIMVKVIVTGEANVFICSAACFIIFFDYLLRGIADILKIS